MPTAVTETLTWPQPGSAEARRRQLCAWALRSGRPLALWRVPGAVAPVLLLSCSLEAAYACLPPALEPSAPAGFAFFPFRDSDHNPVLFLPADVVYDGTRPDELQLAAPALTEELSSLLAGSETEPASLLPWHQSRQPAPPTATQAEYEALVRKGVDAITSGMVQKVVSSRAARWPLPAGFDPLQAFAALDAKYPQAFVSLVSVPGAGTWLGATPEVLAQVTADGRFCTMALAGTQPLTPDVTPLTAIWRQKEIEEQALVARYIVSCFKQLRLREYHETGPRTAVAGELLHLRTDFEVNLNQVPFPNLGTDMLRLLHPTSAVGGMPKAEALAFLQQHEGYDRAYYSGFLGPVNVEAPGVAQLFVNLRCLQLRQNEAILYAGTGLTADSDPAKEWRETELKLRTVGAVLQ